VRREQWNDKRNRLEGKTHLAQRSGKHLHYEKVASGKPKGIRQKAQIN
jgi:hypothetical protein